MVGDVEACLVGFSEGAEDATTVGLSLHFCVGTIDDAIVGVTVGSSLGETDSVAVGFAVGTVLGELVGSADEKLGDAEASVGLPDGCDDPATVVNVLHGLRLCLKMKQNENKQIMSVRLEIIGHISAADESFFLVYLVA